MERVSFFLVVVIRPRSLASLFQKKKKGKKTHPDPAGASSRSITLTEARKFSADSSEPSHPEQGNSILEEEEEEEFPPPPSPPSAAADAAAADDDEDGGETQTFSRNHAVPRSHAEGSTCATRTLFSLPIGWRTRRA